MVTLSQPCERNPVFSASSAPFSQRSLRLSSFADLCSSVKIRGSVFAQLPLKCSRPGHFPQSDIRMSAQQSSVPLFVLSFRAVRRRFSAEGVSRNLLLLAAPNVPDHSSSISNSPFPAPMSAQLPTIQSAPALRNSSSAAVVRTAITRAPAAFPERTPAGTSSTTTQSATSTSNAAAPFRYGSGCGFPCSTSLL